MTPVSDPFPIVPLPEWKTDLFPGLSLSPEDDQLVSLLNGDDDHPRRVGIDDLRYGLRLSAQSWVGVVRFSRFELRIVPKMVGGGGGVVKLIDYATGLDSLDRHPALSRFDAEGCSLLDLVALLFAEACERIARGGLLADYRETEDDLPVVRGRLLADRQVLKRFGSIERLECRFDDHTTDILENRLLLAALSFCSPHVRDPAVSVRIRRLLSILSEACSLENFDLPQAREFISYHRLNEHYREAHDLAKLILEGLGVHDIYTGSDHRRFAFLLDMNRLFEDFVARWLMDLLPKRGFRVRAQRRDRSIIWNADLGTRYARIIPDLLVESANGSSARLPIDSKYKLYDERRIENEDIYQTFLYALAYGGERRELLPSAMILYPASSESGRKVRLHVRRSGGPPSAELHALGIHVPSALREATTLGPTSIGDAIANLVSEALAVNRSTPSSGSVPVEV